MRLARVEYWQKLRDILAENLVFIDESGCNLNFIRSYARSPQGQRAYGSSYPKGRQNVSIIGAISLQGMVASYHVLGTNDGLTFEAYVARILVPNLRAGQVVVMDNCSIHRGEEIKQLIEQAGAKLIFLPPYSPDFSPLENYWCGMHCRIPAGSYFPQGRQSKLKAILRTLGARTYPEFVKAIEEAISQISLQDIHSWFTHCCYCTS